ncbi:MAG: IclR family transcriptional regulator [Frondihabitans sp.]|nr:IclR family transcriptional regulator [Frondihabitans sp.]
MTGVPAARNVLRMIRFLAEQTGPTHAATVARALEIPRSSAYQLLKALQDEGFVVHFPEERGYALSTLLAELGTSSDRAARLRRLGAPLLVKLIARVKLPVVAQLGILHGHEVVCLAKESAHRAPSLVSEVGVHLPAQLTATGRAILAHLEHAQVRALFPDRTSLLARGETGPQTLRELDDQLLETRARGWALERGEITPGYASVAAVVLDHNEYATAAIGLTFRTAAIDQSLVAGLGEAVGVSAAALSMRLRGKI